MTGSNSPANVVASRLAALRGSLLWSQDELARRMTLYGMPWSRTTVAKIENLSRQVTVDELVALAFVLGVSPAALLTPTASQSTVNLTPNTQTPVLTAWAWMNGAQPMGGAEPSQVLTFAESAELARRYDEASPDHLHTAESRLPGLRQFARMATRMTTVAGVPDEHRADALDAAATILADLAEDAAALAKRARREAAMAKQATPAPTTKRKGTK